LVLAVAIDQGPMFEFRLGRRVASAIEALIYKTRCAARSEELR
jgi:hypothetical protein